MPENVQLLELCLANPNDTHALLVYCDWLQETADPRAEYARLQLELKSAKKQARPKQLARLRTLYPVEHPAWCGRFEQAGVFEANLLDANERWWGVGLGARDTPATYGRFVYAQQPPLPVEKLNGTFDWLAAAIAAAPPEEDDGVPSSVLDDDDRDDSGLPTPAGWKKRFDALRRRGFYVPPTLETLMFDRKLQLGVPTCTSNYFLSADDVTEQPYGDGLFVTFYSDQQACVLWGVWLGKGGDRYTPVLAGAPDFEGDALSFPELTFCAPTLESFVYRWWLENTIWFATQWEDDRRPLNAEEQAYLAHLEKRAVAK